MRWSVEGAQDSRQNRDIPRIFHIPAFRARAGAVIPLKTRPATFAKHDRRATLGRYYP